MIHFETDGQVGLITIDRPDFLNALDDAAYQRLWELLRQVDRDPDLRVAIFDRGRRCAPFRSDPTCANRSGTPKATSPCR